MTDTINTIVLAPDSFKDSLPASRVCEAMEEGIKRVNSKITCIRKPVADGGEGTVSALVGATNGEFVKVSVHDPLMRKAQVVYGILGDGNTAAIEMAAASGLELLKPEERNPWTTTTYGVGEMIRHALDKGCRKFVIGLGGSATNDGGMGMARALGVRFLDKDGNPVDHGGGALVDLHRIDVSGLDVRIKECRFNVACDVNNLLAGENGASRVYGPQKGADEAMVEKLDNNLTQLQEKLKSDIDVDVSTLKGGGAAGGLGAGLFAFLGATLEPGFDIVARIVKLEESIKGCDLVITGEGKIDVQTQYGKTPYGVAQLAKKYDKPLLAIAGTLGEGYQDLYKKGFDGIFSIMDKPMPLKEALMNGYALIANACEDIMRWSGSMFK